MKFKPGDKVTPINSEIFHESTIDPTKIYTIERIHSNDSFSLKEVHPYFRFWSSDFELAYPTIFNSKLEEILND